MANKVIKVISENGVFFETGEVDVRKRKDEDGNVSEEITRLTRKYRFKETVRGVPEGIALRLEDARVAIIVGDDEDDRPAGSVAKPPKPAKGSGPAPSVDDLTS